MGTDRPKRTGVVALRLDMQGQPAREEGRAAASHQPRSRRVDQEGWSRATGRSHAVVPATGVRLAQKGVVMKALVFHGSGKSAWEDVADPGIQDATDAIVRVDAVTICGTDLHILKGDLPEVRPGTVLGHEAVGEVVEVGSDVRMVRPGDRVLVSCITACGRCRYCREGSYGQCRAGGAGSSAT